MGEFLCNVAIVALAAAFVITLGDKWGVIEWVQVHGNAFFSEMFRCRFCLSWWVGVVLSLLISAMAGDPLLLFVPFCSTALTRILL